jgi:hypothetical protein
MVGPEFGIICVCPKQQKKATKKRNQQKKGENGGFPYFEQDV